MGFAKCRVVDCPETGSQEWTLSSERLSGIYLWIPKMWRHYAVVHGFWPDQVARSLVMRLATDDHTLSGTLTQMRSAVPDSALKKIEVLKVEKTSDGFDHEQGKIDWEFIQHLDKLLEKIEKK